MYWKKLLWITTLSCNERSMRLRPEYVPEALGSKQLFLNHQYSTGIFFYFLLLLPSILFTYRQTNEDIVGTDSEDFLWFSRNELLHHLLDVLAEITKKMNQFLRNFVCRERILPWSNINPMPSVHRNNSWWRLSRLFSLWFCFCICLAHNILRIQFLTFVLRAELLELVCRCYSSSSQTLFDPWEIMTQEWVLSLFKDHIQISTPYLPCK